MLLKYFYDQPLAHASYMVGCQKTGEAILIDPARNIEQYIQSAKANGLKIIGSVETHIHADYVSGTRELADKLNARIYVSDEGPADWKYTFVQSYDHQLLKENDEFNVGNIRFRVLHTPGHTPESISLLLTDTGSGADKPMGIFTGDFVFVGSIGRPDLLEEAAGQAGTAEPGARDLYRSIQKFRQLPDFLQVWPSHGAGSACGKGLGAIPSSTVGYEKLFNDAFQFEDEDRFVEYVLSDQPEAPPYFAIMKHVNKHGPMTLASISDPVKLGLDELLETTENSQVIDLRNSKDFAKGHVPGTINIPSNFITRDAGWFVQYDQPLYLISELATLEQILPVFREIGIDNIAGYFDIDEIQNEDRFKESYASQTAEELVESVQNGTVCLIDVRGATEWNQLHIPQATRLFLGELMSTISSLSHDKPIVFQCRSGARSAVACSIAQAAGFKNVVNMIGGIQEWSGQGFEVVRNDPVSV